MHSKFVSEQAEKWDLLSVQSEEGLAVISGSLEMLCS